MRRAKMRYDQLRPVMLDLVRDGLLTIEDDHGAQLPANQACDVLENGQAGFCRGSATATGISALTPSACP
jgi:hypothetical protein